MIDHEAVKELFDYKDGKLYWKTYRSRVARAGMEAGTPRRDGYIQINTGGKKYLAHRLVWLWHNEELPEFLDHVNHDRADNRIDNLRAVTKQENNKKALRRKDNTSGSTGVYISKGKWAVQINIDGRQTHLGYYNTKEAAIHARIVASKQHNYSSTHGN